MDARRYRLRRRNRNRINRFTYEDYNGYCQDIKSANLVGKTVNVTVEKGKTGLATQISSILKVNGINVKSWNRHLGSDKIIHFVFDSKEAAGKAADVINNMSMPDSIDPSAIMTDGSVLSNYGVKVKVNVKQASDGSIVASSGGNYVSGVEAKDNEAAAADESSEGSSYTKWIIVGGVALIAAVVVFVVLKKMKK